MPSFHKGTRIAVALCVAQLVSAACAFTKGHFNVAGRSQLEPGKTTATEVIQLLGQPTHIERKTEGSKPTKLGYITAEVTSYGLFVTTKSRSLSLEFDEGGVLTGYDYSSTFQEDAREPAPEALDKLQPGTAQKSEVLALMGEPDGKVRCGTDSDRECIGGESWSYRYPNSQLRLAFGEDGVLSSVETGAHLGNLLRETLSFPPGRWSAIGTSTAADVVAALGPPLNDRRTTRGRQLMYVAGVTRPGGTWWTLLSGGPSFGSGEDLWGLLVDLDAERVRGYAFFSNRPERLSPMPDRVELTLGQTQEEIGTAVGDPHAKWLCPSPSLPDCEAGSVWLWGHAPGVFGGRSDQQVERSATLRLHFDGDGRLIEIGPPESLPEPR